MTPENDRETPPSTPADEMQPNAGEQSGPQGGAAVGDAAQGVTGARVADEAEQAAPAAEGAFPATGKASSWAAVRDALLGDSLAAGTDDGEAAGGEAALAAGGAEGSSDGAENVDAAGGENADAAGGTEVPAETRGAAAGGEEVAPNDPKDDVAEGSPTEDTAGVAGGDEAAAPDEAGMDIVRESDSATPATAAQESAEDRAETRAADTVALPALTPEIIDQLSAAAAEETSSEFAEEAPAAESADGEAEAEESEVSIADPVASSSPAEQAASPEADPDGAEATSGAEEQAEEAAELEAVDMFGSAGEEPVWGGVQETPYEPVLVSPAPVVATTLAEELTEEFAAVAGTESSPSLEESPQESAPLEGDTRSAEVLEVEAPVAEVPVAEAPVEEVLAAEVPVAEVPVEAPVEEVPAAEVPVAEVPVEAPVAEVPVAEAPVEEVPVAEVPVEAPVEEVPVAEVLVAEVPVAEAPVEEIPVAEALVAEVPVAEAPVEEVPVAEVPVAEVPVEAPVAEEPVAEALVAPAESVVPEADLAATQVLERVTLEPQLPPAAPELAAPELAVPELAAPPSEPVPPPPAAVEKLAESLPGDATSVLLGAATEVPAAPQPPAPIPQPPAPSAAAAAQQEGGRKIPAAKRKPADKRASTARLVDFAEAPAKDAKKTKRATMWVSVVALVLAVFYLGGAWYLHDKIPRGTTVKGVEIGGMSHEQARAILTRDLEPRAFNGVNVKAGENTAEFRPAEAGLKLDAAATVNQLVRFTLNPIDLWNALFGTKSVEPVSTVDEAALNKALETLSKTLNVEPINGAITLSNGAAEITQPVDGLMVDVAAAKDVIKRQWLDNSQAIALPTKAVAPDIDKADVDRAMKEFVNPLLSGPIRLTIEGKAHSISANELANMATITAEGGALKGEINGEKLTELLKEQDSALASAGKDAKVVIENGRPTIIPSKPGRGLNPALVAAAANKAATSTTRSEVVELTEADAEFSTKDAEALGIKEVISEFSTPLTADNVRTRNLIVGTGKLNNRLLKPGETFSLLEVISPVSAANGYVISGVVNNGFEAKAIGGGLSQLSTTTYNAAYFAGMDLVEHQPHTRWFQRYPQGREATVWDPQIDMKFKNSTPHGVLIQSWVADRKVWVRFWSTKHFQVKSETSPRYNLTSSQTVHNTAPNCIPEVGGSPGFTVDITRWRYLNGKQFSKENWKWTYQAWPRVICGSPEKPSTPPK